MKAIYYFNEPIIPEVWVPITNKSVVDVKDGYFISNLGRVYSKLSNTFLNQVPTSGYYRVYLIGTNGTGRYHLVHRILMIEFCPIPNYQDMQVNHMYGNKDNNNITCLEWMTASQNIKHAFDTGLKVQRHGEACSYATITDEQAEYVAQLLSENKYSHKEICSITGTPLYIVNSISCGTTWRHLYDRYNLEAQKRETRLGFSDDQLHKVCKYFEDHRHISYRYLNDLYRECLMELFGIKFTNSMSANMSRIYNHNTRKDITDQYNY